MKIHDEDDYAITRAEVEMQRNEKIHKEEEACKFILGIIVILLLGYLFADPIIKALERDDYKGQRIVVVENV